MSAGVQAAGRGVEATDRLRRAGSVFAADEARLLLEAAGDASEFETLVLRRIAGEPLEYILGWAEFCDLRIRVQPGVFVPRKRTEFLVERAAALASQRRHPLVIDVCCGSGAIGAALLTRVEGIEVHATDIDPAAVACARENLGERAVVAVGDLFAGLPTDLLGRVDVIVANAPYVPSAEIDLMPREARLHESRLSLDGGGDGLALHRRISADAVEWLAPGGQLLIETSERQAERTALSVENAGLDARVEHSEEFDATLVIGTR
ncbi:putative protein N(5)-glutamine methyltransferase [Mycetocola zhadangensis]|uniref:peptide chain release factor N(5)-glutamine methyltransferase n=1 Tax=Mycetocola zhadangensis TaxID=1164595 RepID=A0A3L7IS98_9MICO|nr:putative protein N(5)-glutamine methyltransferase [Mycetocola zhadangensis]RLQ81053.1 putative protein N(5)-glutamine methyltransferase [Mycetocola zhadangensis]GGF04394.1 methylase [Mycetocola zhadangensis]